MQSTSCEMPGWMRHKLESRLPGEISIISDTLTKLNIQKTKILAFGPITSWQIDGEKVEIVAYFLFLVSKITANGGCSHEIKRRLLLGKEVMTNLDSVLKSRDIGFIKPTKVHIVKALFFLVAMYRCESWIKKKLQC